jgi:hypothetical protein
MTAGAPPSGRGRYLPAAFALALVSSALAKEPACPHFASIPEQAIYLGYARPSESTLRTFALLAEDSLAAYDGRGLSPGNVMYGLLDESTATIRDIEPHLSRLGEDHCVYSAALSTSARGSWNIWASSSDLRDRVREPTGDDVVRFRRYTLHCLVQGDASEGALPTCAELVAVSDLDGDGGIEYWHTIPYTWDTGFGVAEDRDGRLVPLLSTCVGCSD